MSKGSLPSTQPKLGTRAHHLRRDKPGHRFDQQRSSVCFQMLYTFFSPCHPGEQENCSEPGRVSCTREMGPLSVTGRVPGSGDGLQQRAGMQQGWSRHSRGSATGEVQSLRAHTATLEPSGHILHGLV